MFRFNPASAKLARMLKSNPLKQGVIRRLMVVTPRKPNSARRGCIKLRLGSKSATISYIPGSGHSLRKYSTVFIRGRGARDLPGVYSTAIRGCKDLKSLVHKGRRRSIWGVKRKDYLAYVDLYQR